jgi:ketosteroid isomerase-like protein
LTTAADTSPARDPQDLERLLVARQRAGDVEGMMVLFEPDAVIDHGEGLARGHAAIRRFFIALNASGRKFNTSTQRDALISGDLALTSCRASDGTVTAEVARRQSDGTWRWVIDVYSLARIV